MSKILSSSIKKVSGRLERGELTACQLLDQSLAMLQKAGSLNAFISVTEQQGREQAQRSDQRRKHGDSAGVLDGVPVAVKDNFCVRETRTTCGSRMLAEFRPPYTATVVQRMLDAGATLLGKTNLDEFGMGVGTSDSHFGPTKNVWGSSLPYRLVRDSGETVEDATVPPRSSEEDFYIPGGSSGGSAVAVASGACFAALGSDTGGSVRNPAASCGLVGLKPSYGLLSRHGLIPLVNSLDVPGILTRTVADAATVLNVVSAPDRRDATCISEERQPVSLSDQWRPDRLTVGLPAEYHCPGMDAQVLTAWEQTAALLADGGATVKQVSLPHTQYSISCYSVLNCAEVSSNMARFDGVEFGYRAPEAGSTEAMYAASRRAALGDVVRSRILAGNYFLLRRHYDQYLGQAMRVRRLISDDFSAVWRSGCDLVLTPVTLTDGHLYSEFCRRDNRSNTAALDYCTQPANMAGVPAVSLPVRLSARGLPVSLQLLAPMYAEQCLLQTAHWLERRLDFPRLQLL